MQKKAIALALAAIAVLAAAVTAGVFIGTARDDSDGGAAAARSAAATATPVSIRDGSSGASNGSDCLSAAEIYQRLRPSVVEVLVQSSGGSPFGLPQQGEGSGIVIDKDGSILTNNHVVAGAGSLEVQFADGTSAPADLVGRDPGNDLAVIRVEADGRELTAAPLGQSSALRVGDAVLAIGNPFNLEGTLTQGIVSGLGRTFSPGGNTRPIRNMIQTDAPVNPGNSGGPLINCRGEVVGVNTLLENPTGDNVNVGIAFAVAIDTAKRSLPEMLSGATVRHPWLGIAGMELTPGLARELGLSTDTGVYVTLVASGSPAEAAGLRGAFASEQQVAQSDTPAPGGDVIIEADDRPVATVEELAAYLDESKNPGDAVELRIEREGRELSLQATLAEWPA